MQVVKTRLQLQGELQQRVAKNKRTYRGVWHAFKTIISTEGPLAIQKGTGALGNATDRSLALRRDSRANAHARRTPPGLFPAAAYQFCMNGMRYAPVCRSPDLCVCGPLTKRVRGCVVCVV